MGEGLDFGFRGVLAPAGEAAPEVLGEYRLIRKLGEGGMAQVFLAERLGSPERVALKVLHPRFARNPERVAQLRAEANALRQLGHENVVRIIGLHEEPPFPYLVMEFLDGVPLTRVMGKPHLPRRAIPILVQICRALDAAHRRGVLHRDLKSDNIFLLPRERGVPLVKVLDFGLATSLGEGGAKPGDGAVGTARYMAPEQWEGRALDERTDLYALGVIAFGLATGKPPFAQVNEDDLRWAHCYWPAPDPRSVYPGVTDAWAAVILRALEKDPARRFQSAQELAEAFQAALETEEPILLGRPLSDEDEEPILLGKLVGAEEEPIPLVQPVPEDEEPVLLGKLLSESREEPGVLRELLDSEEEPIPLDTPAAERGPCEEPSVDEAEPVSLDRPVVQGLLPEEEAALERALSETSDGAEVVLAEALSCEAAVTPLFDPAVDEVLGQYRGLDEGDWYAVLGVEAAARTGEIWQRGTRRLKELSALSQARLSPEQREELGRARARVVKALCELGLPHRRILHDAARKNLAGVARCIAVMGREAVEALRAARPLPAPAARRLRRYLRVADTRMQRGQRAGALEAYARALEQDPLDVSAQRRYWALQREVRPCSAPADALA